MFWLCNRVLLVWKCASLTALLVASAFWTVGQMKGGSCRKPSRAVAALFIPVTLLMLSCRGASGSHKMTQTSMNHATASAAGPGHSLTEYLRVNILYSEHFHVWLLSLVGSVAVGLSGIFPLLVIPIEAGAALKTEGKRWQHVPKTCIWVTCSTILSKYFPYNNIHNTNIILLMYGNVSMTHNDISVF